MKGAVIEYKEDRGYGFIRDENGDSRFFHIADMQEKSTFLGNLTDYFYTEWVDRRCFIVTFSPLQSQKGLSAKNIKLTQEILNDKTISAPIEVKITGLRNEVHSLTRITQGFKKGESKPVFATAGSNGTYRLGYPEVTKELLIDFIRTDDIGWGTISVRDLVLQINDRSNITGKLVETLQQKLIGKAARVSRYQDRWVLRDLSLLKI